MVGRKYVLSLFFVLMAGRLAAEDLTCLVVVQKSCQSVWGSHPAPNVFCGWVTCETEELCRLDEPLATWFSPLTEVEWSEIVNSVTTPLPGHYGKMGSFGYRLCAHQERCDYACQFDPMWGFRCRPAPYSIQWLEIPVLIEQYEDCEQSGDG